MQARTLFIVMLVIAGWAPASWCSALCRFGPGEHRVHDVAASSAFTVDSCCADEPAASDQPCCCSGGRSSPDNEACAGTAGAGDICPSCVGCCVTDSRGPDPRTPLVWIGGLIGKAPAPEAAPPWAAIAAATSAQRINHPHARGVFESDPERLRSVVCVWVI